MDRDYPGKNDNRVWFTVVVVALVLILGSIAYILASNNQNPANRTVTPGIGGGPMETPSPTPTPATTQTPSPTP